MLLVGVYLAADWWFCLPEGEVAEYVGRQKCVDCHAKEAELWTGSDHDRAMDPATAETVLGDFGDREFDHFGVKSRLFRRGEEFCVTTDNRDGKMETFRIKYVLGYRPLQQYLVEFADGRVQCLPVAWDTVEKRWFHLYPEEPIPHDDPLHWTRPFQNWNYMCADCHTTNLRKNYRLADNTYHTTFSEMDVSCETCHGPGSLHVRLAESKKVFWDRRYGYGLPNLKDQDHRVQVEACAPCHARRRIVYPDFRPGGKFLDHYVPELLGNIFYYPDGQILDEDYEYGSFLQSRMYHEKVRCTNCHDAHTTRVKFPDNRLCGQCHLPTQYDAPSHHHHPDATKPGTRCVECHMPTTPYMVVDPRLDHSIRIPRPDLTVSLGIPNACSGCHSDAAKGETPQWAEGHVEKWYGKRKVPPHFAHAFDAARKGEPVGEELLAAVASRPETRPIVRASAIALLAGYESPAARSAALDGLKDQDDLVRWASVRALEHLPADQLPGHLAPLLRDPLRAVRTEAARILVGVPRYRLNREDHQALDAAVAEYMAGLESLSDQPSSHLQMGLVYGDLGEFSKAENAYKTALGIDPEFYLASVNLAMLFGQENKKEAAEQQFRKAIEQIRGQLAVFEGLAAKAKAKGVPAGAASQRMLNLVIEERREHLADAHYSLGLLLAENEKRFEEAAERLAAAAKLAPSRARIRYNLAQVLHKLGRSKEAVSIAEELVRLHPDDAEFQGLLEYLRREAAGKKESELPIGKPF